MSVGAAPLPGPTRGPRPVPELPGFAPADGLVGGRSGRRDAVIAGLVLVCAWVAGYAISSRSGALVHNRMLPWILGRSFGVACYLTLSALVAVGLWLRHPWRAQLPSPRPESLLRGHVALAAATLVLLIGHLSSITLDRYAGVGWIGALMPGHAHYRPAAVALGTFAFYGVLLVGGTAALAGFIGRRIWFPIHTVSAGVLCLCIAHGVLAGSDSRALRWMYVASGAVVLLLQLTRWSARRTAPFPVESR